MVPNSSVEFRGENVFDKGVVERSHADLSFSNASEDVMSISFSRTMNLKIRLIRSFGVHI